MSSGDNDTRKNLIRLIVLNSIERRQVKYKFLRSMSTLGKSQLKTGIRKIETI